MTRLGVFLLPLDRMLVHRRSFPCNLLGFPKNLPVPIYTPGWREALWELSVFPKNTTQCPLTLGNRSLRPQDKTPPRHNAPYETWRPLILRHNAPYKTWRPVLRFIYSEKDERRGRSEDVIKLIKDINYRCLLACLHCDSSVNGNCDSSVFVARSVSLHPCEQRIARWITM